MPVVDIIYPIETLEWASPMVIQLEKNDLTRLHICVDYCGLNKLIVTDAFPTPFCQ